MSESDILDSVVTPDAMFNACAQAAMRRKASFAAWSMPRSSDWHVLISQANEPQIDEFPKDGNTGFILHPFTREAGSNPKFLPADLVYNSMDKQLSSITGQIDPDWFDEIEAMAHESIPDLPEFFTSEPTSGIHKLDQEDLYVNWVKKAIQEMRSTDLEKVVLARTHLTHDSIDPIRFFTTLRKLYPHAFVSLVSTPEYGTWIGASPELLLAVNDINQFRTVSLAGTEPVDDERTPIRWTDKEFEEQEIVSRYILKRIRQLGISQIHVEGPYTHQAGNVYHLRTDITGSLASATDTSKLVNILHPTPAVCGRPKQQALDFIRETEPFHRKLYAGYLGPVNLHGETRLYVNLRCLRLLETGAVVYAGAGLTSDSIPEAEWAETTLKCQTLLQGLHA